MRTCFWSRVVHDAYHHLTSLVLRNIILQVIYVLSKGTEVHSSSYSYGSRQGPPSFSKKIGKLLMPRITPVLHNFPLLGVHDSINIYAMFLFELFHCFSSLACQNCWKRVSIGICQILTNIPQLLPTLHHVQNHFLLFAKMFCTDYAVLKWDKASYTWKQNENWFFQGWVWR